MEELLVLKKLDRNGIVGIDLRIVPRAKGCKAIYWVRLETRAVDVRKVWRRIEEIGLRMKAL